MAARRRESVLSAYTRQLGTVPDQKVAEAAGVSRTLVVNYRKRLGIPAYNGHKQPSPAAPHAAPAAFRGRRSALDPYRALLGTVPDREVARQAGVTAENVRTYRQRRNIPPTASDAQHGDVRPQAPAQHGDVRPQAPAVSQPPRTAAPRPRPTAATESPRPLAATEPRPLAAAEPRPLAAGTAFLITVDTDQGARSYALVAASIAEAANAAAQRLAARHPDGVIRLIQRIAELLP